MFVKNVIHTSLLLLTRTLSTFVCSDWFGWNSYAGSKYQPDIEDLSSWEYNKMWCELLHFLRKLQYIHEISFACQFHYNIFVNCNMQRVDSSTFAFWSKSPVDIEPRRIRLQSNSYTTNTLLDTVTAATIQVFNIFNCLF